MKQLKLDQYLVRSGIISPRSRPPSQHEPKVDRERSVLQAFSEYEDVQQNVYMHRARKNPMMDDDIPLCRCCLKADWSLTCMTLCENRATQTECVLGECSKSHYCSNQRMQRGDHAALELQIVPGKGIALIAEKVIEKDELVAQYVGEVLSLEMYLERERKKKTSKHTYGMAVTTNEVIDARNIGGIARFANHSCCPNCLVERWEVAGETCCGLFAKKTIFAGEEITIDYGSAFVRSKAKFKCLCKATNCKGYL